MTSAAAATAVLEPLAMDLLLASLERLAGLVSDGLPDEERYLPATSSPATKEPMMDLLRRVRSKGFGILLASQNPGDFDYRGRENINTWFVGKVSQERSLGKLRDLLGDTAAASLPNLPRGQFFLVRSPPPREVRADRSLMDTIELGPDEVLALARAAARS